MLYSGIDLYKDMCFISTIDESGIMLKQSKVPNDEHAILNYFSRWAKSIVRLWNQPQTGTG